MKICESIFSNHFFLPKILVYSKNVILQNLTLVLFYRLFATTHIRLVFSRVLLQLITKENNIEMCKNAFFANAEI